LFGQVAGCGSGAGSFAPECSLRVARSRGIEGVNAGPQGRVGVHRVSSCRGERTLPDERCQQIIYDMPARKPFAVLALHDLGILTSPHHP